MTRRPPADWQRVYDEMFLTPDPATAGGWAPGMRVTITAACPWPVPPGFGGELRDLIRARITRAEGPA